MTHGSVLLEDDLLEGSKFHLKVGLKDNLSLIGLLAMARNYT